jgi:hypothetical protein
MAGPHYVTKYLLRHFAGEQNLFEWDKATQKAVPRTLREAGSEEDIWPEEIEREEMQQWDNPAHKVLQAKVHRPGLTEITLSPEERKALNEWLFIHLVRSPAHRQRCVNLHNAGLAVATHHQYLGQNRRALFAERRQFIHAVEINRPDEFAASIAKYGRQKVENTLMYHYDKMLSSGEVLGAKDGVNMYHQMLQSGQYRLHMKKIRGMKWTWLRTDQDFVIGDNPYDRCDSRSGAFNCGISMPNLEIFFPLGRHLCLWMHRRKRSTKEMLITEAQTKELNLRQLQNAVAKAWGSSDSVFSTEGRFSETSPIS